MGALRGILGAAEVGGFFAGLGYNSLVVLAGVTALGVAAGAVGCFAQLRGRALLGDVLAHATLPGIGGAFLLAGVVGVERRSMAVLMVGAAAAGLVGVWGATLLARNRRVGGDAAMAIVLASMFGLGAVLLTVVQRVAPAESAGLNRFVLGQAAAMRLGEAQALAAAAMLVVVVVFLLFKELRVLCFDARFAASQGLRVGVLDAVLMLLVTLTSVAGLQAVGIVMIVALLVIPAATARLWCSRVGGVVAVAAVVGGVGAAVGAAVSASAERVPTGAAIVLTVGAMFAVSVVVSPTRGVAGAAVRRARAGGRIVRDHMLRAAWESAERRGGVAAAGDAFDARGLAQRAGVRGWKARAAVAGMLARGQVARSRGGGGLVLTEGGARVAARITRAHRLIEHFLVASTAIDAGHAHVPADLAEHSVSDAALGRLERRLAELGVDVSRLPDIPPVAGGGPGRGRGS